MSGPDWPDVVEPCVRVSFARLASVAAPVGRLTVPEMFVIFQVPDCLALTVPAVICPCARPGERSTAIISTQTSNTVMGFLQVTRGDFPGIACVAGVDSGTYRGAL